MILDTLAMGTRYAALHPAFSKAMAFLNATDLAALPEGRHDIDGDRVYALVMQVQGRGQSAARLEAHRRYIDIQVTVTGEEVIGWRQARGCTADEPFDAKTDLGFFRDVPLAWITIPAGCFAVFYPEDAHAPLAGSGPALKVVVKVAVD